MSFCLIFFFDTPKVTPPRARGEVHEPYQTVNYCIIIINHQKLIPLSCFYYLEDKPQPPSARHSLPKSIL
jgi:hypothetical protein